ncbi:Hypothetical predicted protein [Olea europaea subsp. europaea]|uniref:Uncharacterized protein n=1 Tax=Olea europaea subsp. europaea TaxID=158383 RepID=A0A8S0SVP8_OLEEU|nr:Hypothetical predicted protein [Olea europaea subsp. europaea]
MENSDSTASVPPPAPLSVKKENVMPINPKIAELTESRQELLTRIQKLKEDLQGWRTKLDTQVKVYRDELSELKNSLNTEVEQLRSDFQELKTTLQQQQEDVTASLRNLGVSFLMLSHYYFVEQNPKFSSYVFKFSILVFLNSLAAGCFSRSQRD